MIKRTDEITMYKLRGLLSPSLLGLQQKTPTDVSQYALYGVLSSYTTQIQHMIMSPLLVFRWEVGIPQPPLSDHPHMHCRGKVHMWHFVSTCSLSVVLTNLLCSGVETNILCTTGSLLDINWHAPWKPSITVTFPSCRTSLPMPSFTILTWPFLWPCTEL